MSSQNPSPNRPEITADTRAGAEPCATCYRTETQAWGRSWVEVDLAALRRNTGRVAAALPPEVGLIAIIKKDAYGHGMLAVAEALAGRPEIGGFGVVTVEEGLALRHAGVTRPILCFAVLEGEALADAVRHELLLTVTNLTEAAEAAGAAAAQGRRARAHLKVDTGMGRMGRLPAEVAGEIDEIMNLPDLELGAVYSHMADAWGNRDGAREQAARLEAFRRDAGLKGLPCHWGGSDALGMEGLLRPGDWLRSGIALYGSHPAVAGLEPVMTFKSRVIYRRRVGAGTPISYGGTHTTTRETELALVGAGYGNGLPRALSGRGATVLIRGRRCPILGRVCMDQAIVDVTEAGEVGVGEEAVLFGRQGEALLPAAEQATLAGTISYELFCLAGQLNPRVYLQTS